ncbi:MAG: hypothetical protein FJ386_13210 [Verrucomicrobia bacterium]|nr:hypothetical protein [Verrucomicrobiota bacterium]
MDALLYWLARALVAVVQALPLPWVVKLGRAGGAVAFALDARHREVALRNLAMCLGAEREPEQIEAIARENFRRIGESYACAIKTASMSTEEAGRVLDLSGVEKLRLTHPDGTPRNAVFAVGHFGNFEMYARTNAAYPDHRIITTYRSLRQPGLNRLLHQLRSRSGARFLERRTEAAELKAAMHSGRAVLGLLADQHAGDRGLRLPLFGHDCSTSSAPAIFALRYRCPLYPSICFRVAPGRWRVEYGDEIATHDNGHPRPIEAITTDVNRAFEAAIRRDPANWFWVHNRWKPGKWREARSAPQTRGDRDGQ